MTERAAACALLLSSAVYLCWVGWSAYLALDPQVTSRGLSRSLPPPRVTRRLGYELTVLDQRWGTLEGELARRYSVDPDDMRRALTARAPLHALAAHLSHQGSAVRLAPLQVEAELPALVWLPTGAHKGVHLVIGRYAGGWVRYEPSVGVVLGPPPEGWLGALSLTSPALREQRW